MRAAIAVCNGCSVVLQETKAYIGDCAIPLNRRVVGCCIGANRMLSLAPARTECPLLSFNLAVC